MSNDHVGVPKFIEKGFSHDNQVMVFNVPLGKEYICNVDNLGVQRNYYEKDIEKDLLATNLEYKFSLFYSTFLSSNPAVFPEIIENIQSLPKYLETFHILNYLELNPFAKLPQLILLIVKLKLLP